MVCGRGLLCDYENRWIVCSSNFVSGPPSLFTISSMFCGDQEPLSCAKHWRSHWRQNIIETDLKFGNNKSEWAEGWLDYPLSVVLYDVILTKVNKVNIFWSLMSCLRSKLIHYNLTFSRVAFVHFQTALWPLTTTPGLSPYIPTQQQHRDQFTMWIIITLPPLVHSVLATKTRVQCVQYFVLKCLP